MPGRCAVETGRRPPSSSIEQTSDRILGLTVFGAEASEVMAAVQVAMLGGLPFTVLRDALFTHPTAAEGLTVLLSDVPRRVALLAALFARL